MFSQVLPGRIPESSKPQKCLRLEATYALMPCAVSQLLKSSLAERGQCSGQAASTSGTVSLSGLGMKPEPRVSSVIQKRERDRKRREGRGGRRKEREGGREEEVREEGERGKRGSRDRGGEGGAGSFVPDQSVEVVVSISPGLSFLDPQNLGVPFFCSPFLPMFSLPFD